MAKISQPSYHLKLSFTTWVCPEWTVDAIIDGMKSYKYEGVEFRTGKGHLHGIEADSQPEYLTEVRKQFDEANLAISCLATSYSFSSADAAERRKNLESAKQIMKVADALGAPYVRVLGGDIPKDVEVTGTVDYVAEALGEIAEYIEAEKLRPMVLIETHGSFSHSKYLSEVLNQVYSPKIGILWDLSHPMRVLEKVEDTYDMLGEFIRHVHVHDFQFNDDRTKISACTPGQGFVPMARVIDQLKAGVFRGYLSLEALGMKADPDDLLPAYANYIRKLIEDTK